MEYSKEAFLRALKTKRAERGWNQSDLAEHSGISVDAIANYESGRSKPYFETVIRLADTFQCSIEDFVTIKEAE